MVQDDVSEDDFSECTSPVRYDQLDEGLYEFSLYAVDNAGNAGEPRSFIMAVDRTAPAVR